MSLALYRKKRNFKKTTEPRAVKGQKKSNLSFVVQRHHASHLHYDFRLEMQGVLKSWAVPKGPSMVAGEKRLAVMVEDHPLPYGKFYGEIPKGNYGAGVVEIWDNGTYTPMIQNVNPEKSLTAQLHKGDLKFILNGKHLKGAFALVRMHDDTGKNWLLIKKSDEHAQKHFKIENVDAIKSPVKKKAKTKNKSDKKTTNHQPSQKNLVAPEKKPFPAGVPKPMLAKLSEQVVDAGQWLYEIKYDGYRVISKINNGKVELLSRNGNSFTKAYTTIASELETVRANIILDGEAVIENKKGLSDFQLLQNYRTTGEGTLKYYVFDILYLDGHDITDFPLMKRKELLNEFFKNYTFTNIFNSDYKIGNGKTLFKKYSDKGYEGIIAKNIDSTYHAGSRSGAWLKIKTTQMQEAVICGYTMPQNSRKYFGSLILGVYDGSRLKYIGNCGTGFTDASLKELHIAFEKLKITHSSFDEIPDLKGTKGKPVWLRPELVCNVKFSEWTQDVRLRIPVFMGLRIDKEASEVVNESKTQNDKMKNNSGKEKIIVVAGKKVKCTNPDKIYWPGENYTKGDLIDYYKAISKYILPYLKNRPQSLNRHPNGIAKESFYQKDMDFKQLPSWAKTAKLYSKSNKGYIDYLICNDTATLIYMANLGCIEINPWHSTYIQPDNPSYMMLDLDPGKISFVDVINTALVVKEVCDEAGISCFCKTSGATGLHIFIPLGAKYTYDEVKTFGEIIAVLTHRRLPNTTSIERSTSKRKDKIYIDFLQNRKGQTISAPYSVRPRPYAPVSTPLLWKEVNHKLTPEMFTIKNMEKRLQKTGDLWQPVLKKGIVLSKALKQIEKL